MKQEFGNIGVTEFRLYADKTRKELIKIWQIHNDVKQAMIGREVLWTAQTTTTQPIFAMRITSNIGDYQYQTILGNNGNHWQEWTVSHEAPQNETVSQVDILNVQDAIYADVTGLAIVLTQGQVLDVIYKHTWTKVNEQIGDIYLSFMKAWFVTAQQSVAVNQIITTLTYDSTELDFATLTGIDSGGTISHDYVTWYSTPKNTEATGSITKVTIPQVSIVPGNYLVHTEEVGIVTWELNATKRIEVTFTWAETV